MDACAAKTIRTLLLVGLALVAAYGLWDLIDSKACKKQRSCTVKYASIIGGVLFVGLALTTLVIVNDDRLAADGYDASLAENIS